MCVPDTIFLFQVLNWPWPHIANGLLYLLYSPTDHSRQFNEADSRPHMFFDWLQHERTYPTGGRAVGQQRISCRLPSLSFSWRTGGAPPGGEYGRMMCCLLPHDPPSPKGVLEQNQTASSPDAATTDDKRIRPDITREIYFNILKILWCFF